MIVCKYIALASIFKKQSCPLDTHFILSPTMWGWLINLATMPIGLRLPACF